MATILAHITVKPGTEAEFESIAGDLHASSHAHDRGLLRYEYWRGADERTYYTLLSFEDHRAFIEHQVSDHHETASPALGGVIDAIRLEWVDPIAGLAPLPATERQTAADDADDLTTTYADRYAAVIQSWWQPLRA